MKSGSFPRVEDRRETAVQESVQRPHPGFPTRTVTPASAQVDVGVHEPGNEIFPGAVDAGDRLIHGEALGGNGNDAIAFDQHGRSGDGGAPGAVDEGDALDEELLGRGPTTPEPDGEGGEQDGAQELHGSILSASMARMARRKLRPAIFFTSSSE